MIKTLKTFYSFVARRKALFAFFILLTVITEGLLSIGPYFYKLFVDQFVELNYQKLINLLFLFMAVKVVSHILNIVGYYLGDVLVFDAAAKARIAIFKFVQDLDFAFHSSKSTGSLISAFKRGDGAFFNLFFTIHHRIISVLTNVFVMSYFFTALDARILLLTIGSFVITLIAAKFLVRINVVKRSLFNKEEDNISGIIVDNMINYETVKLFAKENWEQRRLKEAFLPWKKTLWGYANSFRLIDISIGAIINLTIFFVLFISLNLAVSDKLTVGEFVLIASFLSFFFAQLWDLVWSFRDIAKNYSDIETYFGLLDNKILIKDPSVPSEIEKVDGEIEFKNVHFSYGERKKNAINGLSLKIRQGQAVALVGRSGSGKTTFVKLLMRFFDPQKGIITLDEVDLRNLKKSVLRSYIGVVPQEPILFNNTIIYNIGYGKENATSQEIKAAAAMANIDQFIETLPEKYETQVGERGVKLSGGQKQRLAIARMILSQPNVIIFDEATSHLDSESENLIQDAFWKARQNKTTIIIAHRLSTVMRADKIVVMENGKIAEMGSHNELLDKKESLYKHFWQLQMR